MSVLNQMLRDLESRGISAAPAAVPATPLRGAIAHSAGDGARGSRLRKVLWFGTAMVVTATASFWAVLEHRVSEAQRAPQPLGMQQFGNAISMIGTTEAALTAPTAPATESAASAPAAALASISPSSAANGSDTTKAASETTIAGRSIASGTTSDSAARGALPTATSPPATSGAAPARALPSKHRAPVALAATAMHAADAKTPGVAADAQASTTPIIRATETDIARAADLIARGRNSEAQVVLERVLAASPQQVAARQALAALHAESGQRDRALAVLLDGAAIDAPHFAGPAAQLQFEFGDTRGALTTLARIPLAQRSGQHDALAAGIAFSAGMFGDAVVSYERAVRTPNAPAIWWLGLGLSYEASGQRSDAHETFARLANATALPNDLRAFVTDKIGALAAPVGRADRAPSEIAAGAPTR